MLIDSNRNLQQVPSATNATDAKVASASAPDASVQQPVATDKVTLSDAARQQIDRDGQFAAALNLLREPVPVQSKKTSKRHTSELPLLDVDSMRLIRDKLRAQNLKTQEPTLQEKKNRDDKQENDTIGL